MSRAGRILLCLGLVGLLTAATAIVAARGTGASAASFTTQSATEVTASTDTNSSWVHVYSRGTDPDAGDRAGYANQNGVTPATPCASGQDEGIAIHMGKFPWTLLSRTYQFNRVITLKTPAEFVDPSITQVTVTTSLVDDAATGVQPLSNAFLAPVGSTGGSTSVNLGANQKAQLNLRVTVNIVWRLLGDTFRPRLRLTISFAGSPSGYYVYEYPVVVAFNL